MQKQTDDPVSLFYLAELQIGNENNIEAQSNIKKAIAKDAELMTPLKENQDLYRLWLMPNIDSNTNND